MQLVRQLHDTDFLLLSVAHQPSTAAEIPSREDLFSHRLEGWHLWEWNRATELESPASWNDSVFPLGHLQFKAKLTTSDILNASTRHKKTIIIIHYSFPRTHIHISSSVWQQKTKWDFNVLTKLKWSLCYTGQSYLKLHSQADFIF